MIHVEWLAWEGKQAGESWLQGSGGCCLHQAPGKLGGGQLG